MKTSKKASGMAEAIVVILIVLTGVTGMYQIYSSSIHLERSTTNKIKAIQIAREGIEGMVSIRNTNWILFSGDYKNCWNTLNYNSGCMNNTKKESIEPDTKYKIYKDTDNRWKLEATNITTENYIDNTYRDAFRIGLDNDGFYTATGTMNILKPIFTREIQVEYLNPKQMQVKSIVQWDDKSSKNTHKVQLETLLTNWK